MPKRKNDVVTAEDDDDDDDRNTRDKSQQQQQPPQKVYDFHKKTIEVYPQRLLELNRQFAASISSQVEAEGYSVLVGNCLDYVRQYFTYEDDLLQYSPWLAVRLKQSRSDIVKCLQETIDVYEALARHDFDRILEKNYTSSSSDGSVANKATSSAVSFQPPPVTTSSSASVLNFPKSTTTTASSDTTGFSFSKSTGATSDSTPSTGFTLPKFTLTTETSATTSSFASSKSTAAIDSSPSTGFTFSKLPTTTAAAASESSPSTGFTFSKSLATASDSSPSTGFSFKMPTNTASPDKAPNPSPFAFNIPSTGFGTSTFSSSSFGNPASAEKSSTSSASSISFAPPPSFSFGSAPSAASAQPSTTEDNEDEPSEPPEPEKVEHEADAKLTYRCRMGVKKGDKLIKRGPVQVVLKEANGKHQLIVRSDDALGRLYLNILWAKPIEAKKNSTKDLTFVCHLNPGMPEVKEGEVVVILLRFDNESDRNDAHDKLNKERA